MELGRKRLLPQKLKFPDFFEANEDWLIQLYADLPQLCLEYSHDPFETLVQKASVMYWIMCSGYSSVSEFMDCTDPDEFNSLVKVAKQNTSMQDNIHAIGLFISLQKIQNLDIKLNWRTKCTS